MHVIPAIDIKDGRCVRLRQGDMAAETIYSEDLVSVARGWQQKGATWLHVVDLNGAVDGKPSNAAHIEGIVKAVGLTVQVGGGIRSIETLRHYSQIGVARVVLGTAALTDRPFLEQACREFPGRVLVGVDARNGKVAVKGWTSVSETSICPGKRSPPSSCSCVSEIKNKPMRASSGPPGSSTQASAAGGGPSHFSCTIAFKRCRA